MREPDSLAVELDREPAGRGGGLKKALQHIWTS
jgi:hypothetical protein